MFRFLIVLRTFLPWGFRISHVTNSRFTRTQSSFPCTRSEIVWRGGGRGQVVFSVSACTSNKTTYSRRFTVIIGRFTVLCRLDGVFNRRVEMLKVKKNIVSEYNLSYVVQSTFALRKSTHYHELKDTLFGPNAWNLWSYLSLEQKLSGNFEHLLQAAI